MFVRTGGTQREFQEGHPDLRPNLAEQRVSGLGDDTPFSCHSKTHPLLIYIYPQTACGAGRAGSPITERQQQTLGGGGRARAHTSWPSREGKDEPAPGPQARVLSNHWFADLLPHKYYASNAD